MFRRLASRVVPQRMAQACAFSTTLRCLAPEVGFESFQVAAVTKPAPAWTAKAVVNGAISKVSLSDYKGKYVVMLFYPLDFTFVCPTEITAFSDRHDEFEKIGAQVVALSVDNPFSHLAWVNMPRKRGGLGDMKIPVVSDLTKDISHDYGVLLEEEGFALRGLFIIDPKGILRHITVNDTQVGRNVDEVLRVVQAFQWSDKHGEVVPCNWKPGEKTINPAKASEYFEKQ